VKKLRIGFDFDDVLVASGMHTVELHNRQYGTHLTLENWYDDQSNVKPWQVDDFSDIVRRVIEIQSGEEFYDVEPLQDAREVLKVLKKAGHDLLVITGRPSQLRSNTQRLLEKYYKGIFDSTDLRFTDYYGHEGKHVHKGDIAVELELTHFVDDVVQHANSVAGKGVTTVLFGDSYHWNQAEPDHGVIRMGSWKALGEFFEKEAERLRLQ
jgi:uncharacterized HAD superfamily protein